MNQISSSLTILIKDMPKGELLKDGFKGQWWNPLPSEIIDIVSKMSWKEDCPVPLKDLAYVRVTYLDFKSIPTTGELIYHIELALEIVEIFQELFEAKFPIGKMILIDHYNAQDEISMEDNNSSAFCFRPITGKPGAYSNHSYGGTIDINPFLNPYLKDEVVLPKNSKLYCDRSQDIPGLIKENDSCFNAFIKRGYAWGGHWKPLKDYQHFEKKPEAFIPGK